jgi:hypothetical protein
VTALLRAKRDLETKVGPVQFRRGGFRDTEEHDVEARDADGWLGGGDTHADALEDCHETLRQRTIWGLEECRGDEMRQQQLDREFE